MATEATMQPFTFDASILSKKADIPQQLVWSESYRVTPEDNEELILPIIDLGVFLSGKNGDVAVDNIVRQVGDACKKHGFFLVMNHGVDPELMNTAQRLMREFFNMGLEEKEQAKRKLGNSFGYSSSFTGRFKSNLPWKETFSVPANQAEKYVSETLGQGFQNYGSVLQNYCKAMSKLSLELLEVMGLSLGVGQSTFREFYEDNESVFRANYYPSCPKPDLALGTGPHYDPNSLTILQQDEVPGLQVFVDGKWYTISPRPNTFVINVGDTFMALTNMHYKSCLHRALVNNHAARASMVFFLCPKNDKIVRPPMSLVDADHPRTYPDFTWGSLLNFTQLHHRADHNTANAFAQWLQENKEDGISV